MNEIITVTNNQIQIQQDFIERYRAFQEQKALMEIEEKELKKALLEAMEQNNIKSFDCEGLRITLKHASTRKTVDTALMKEHGIYDMYTKDSEVKANVVITLK